MRVAWAERQEEGEVLELLDPETSLLPGGLDPRHSPGLLNCLVLEVDVGISRLILVLLGGHVHGAMNFLRWKKK